MELLAKAGTNEQVRISGRHSFLSPHHARFTSDTVDAEYYGSDSTDRKPVMIEPDVKADFTDCGSKVALTTHTHTLSLSLSLSLPCLPESLFSRLV